ncbi:Nac domain [Thalictrum thalictroides]|uniref:Nac domain n=1 Tax=Thalictrum thalictroides TaxID=46969 RepID=A0A7J6WL47_THATH|nr:Nac domain [Thalictrum thalictroides]
MAKTSLPPGFRFHPMDVELIMYYLKRKVMGKPLRIEAIAELDLYKFAPWDLPDKSFLRSKDLEWYFFCPRDRKYNHGPRTNRATEIGYWKTTGRDRPICNGSQTVGMKKTLIFHLGRAPQGKRTDWVMHEYRLDLKDLVDAGISQDSYVLCKIFEKSGAGPKNGEQHGAPFKEEEWEDDLEDDSLALLPHVNRESPSVVVDDEKQVVAEDSALVLGKTCESSLQLPCQNELSDTCNENLPLLDGVDLGSILAMLGDGNDPSHIVSAHVEDPPLYDSNDIFGGLNDLDIVTELKGIDNFELVNIEDNCVSGQTRLGEDIAYMELDDMDRPLKYPVKGDGANNIQNGNFSYRSEMEGDDEFGCLNSSVSRVNTDSMRLDDLDFPLKYPLEVTSENVQSGCHFGHDNYDSLGASSVLFVSGEAVFHAPEVGSSSCIHPKSSGVFADNLDLSSNFKNHIGYGESSACGYQVPNQTPGVRSSRCTLPQNSGFFANSMDLASNLKNHIGFEESSVCGYQVPHQIPKNLSGGIEETVNTNSSQPFARGEQHTANSRLRCLLGSIPARPASAAEFPSCINAGKGSNGKSLFANHGGSSIHVKAEVTVRCGCTDEALSGKLEGDPCLCCYGRKYLRSELGKEATPFSSGLTFFFLLGMITALMWVILFSVVVKIGCYVWKLVVF